MVLCFIANVNGTSNRYYVATRKLLRPRTTTSAHRGKSQMAGLTCNSSESKPPRGALLRMLDTLAEWQMRHSHRVISRAQADNATMTGVTQPSSANERSSTSPCDL
jgi:hypothetical protein